MDSAGGPSMEKRRGRHVRLTHFKGIEREGFGFLCYPILYLPDRDSGSVWCATTTSPCMRNSYMRRIAGVKQVDKRRLEDIQTEFG